MNNLNLLQTCQNEQSADVIYGPIQPELLREEVLADLLEASARRNPQQVALIFGEHRISYGELDRQADQVASALIKAGVRPGHIVGLWLPRGIELLVMQAGIAKAGAAWLPLDQDTPVERLQICLDDASAVGLVSCNALSPLLAGSGLNVWTAEALLTQTDAALVRRSGVLPDHPAYVIYTSGSTGQPKGVVISHGALANYVQGVLERLSLDDGASMAMVSTVAADLGHTLLFGALASGRPLHLLSHEQAFDPDGFARYMAEHQVGVLKIVPGHLAALLQASHPADVLPQHALIVGGEACSPALVEQVRQLKPDCRVINHYGPSETTVGVLTHELKVDTIPCGSELVREEASTGLQKAEALLPLSRASEASPGSLPQGLYLSTKVPVGAPLPGASAYVLDDVLNPVGTQVAGELYIGGDSVALGYIGQPALTAERFVPDPFAENGARAYRSGDRMRRNHQGLLEFIGRADDQVKVRGYRVEPAEVARVLLNLPSVAQASVLALPVDEDESRLQLVSYCVAAAGASLTVDNLREQLAARLPDYMVPAQIMLLDSLPLTANGKLDKRALPKPGVVKQRYTAPVGEIEEKLAAVWADVLKLEQVGSTDNFFELGGDSILSLQIIARAKRQGIKLSPKQLFEKQTISQLA
ncbi:Non-ribosomal peptide synthetase, partial [Pseudomonas savastanoi]